MAAHEDYISPWALSIQDLLSKTQKNLKRTSSASHNAHKSSLLSTTDLLSTNFSLDKSEIIDTEINNLKREILAELKEGCENNCRKINKIKSKLESLETTKAKVLGVKSSLMLEMEDCERKVRKAIMEVNNKDFVRKSFVDEELRRAKEEVEAEARRVVMKFERMDKREVDLTREKENLILLGENLVENSMLSSFAYEFRSTINTALAEKTEKISDSWTRSLSEIETFIKQIDSLLSFNFSQPRLHKLTESSSFFPHQSPTPSSFYENNIKPESLSYRLSSIINFLSCSKAYYSLSSEALGLKNQFTEKLSRLDEISARLSLLEQSSAENLPDFVKVPENFTKINISNMGESDDDSISFASPNISPMNQLLNYGNSTKHISKKFVFSGDTIHEKPIDEEERFSPDL